MENNKITRFRGEYAFLSNFYESPLMFQGIPFRNAEAAFQAQKCADEKYRGMFSEINAREAKKLGRSVKLRTDWEAVKVSIMREVVKAKFEQNEKLAFRLASTAGMELIEGNSYRDVFWGVDAETGEGKNHLGRILMEIRSELPNEILEKALISQNNGVIHCEDCQFLRFSDMYGECGKGYRGIVNANDSCGHGVLRESHAPETAAKKYDKAESCIPAEGSVISLKSLITLPQIGTGRIIGVCLENGNFRLVFQDKQTKLFTNISPDWLTLHFDEIKTCDIQEHKQSDTKMEPAAITFNRVALICAEEDGISCEKYPTLEDAKNAMAGEADDEIEDDESYPESDTGHVDWEIVDFTEDIEAAVALALSDRL